jgi:CheY-like chemotaxis protein
LQADLTRLTQVVTNVLNNAAKYTEPGGSIVLRAWRDDAAGYVSVRDTGTGIDPADVSSVFGMFTQLAPARSRAGGGLGIGLALSRGIVELHGGTIEAHSEGRGKGSEFTVRLPLPDHAEDGARTSTAGSGSLPGRQRHGRVLVVDDNVDAAATLGTLLAMEGYEVRTAAGGAEALHIDETWEPDAMVVDIGMPEMSGYELCERVRARHHQPEPLLIACTGWGQAEDRRKSRAVGFDAHLVKPVEPEAVMQVLARMGRAGRP